MRAIILAAGIGKRLAEISKGRPKSMIEVGGKTLLGWHLTRLADAGVLDITVVVGFGAQLIEAEVRACRPTVPVRCVMNPNFQGGSAWSLCAAGDVLRSGTSLVMDADLVYGPELVERLVAASPPNCLLVDSYLHDSGEEVKAAVDAAGRVRALGKKLDRERGRVAGESVGMFKFDRQAGTMIADRLEKQAASADPALEYEPVLDGLLDEADIRYQLVTGLPWTEIDFAEDVRRARQVVYPRIERLPRQLSNAELTAFRRDGFLIQCAAFSKEEIAAIGDSIDELAGRQPELGGPMVYLEDRLTIAGERILSRIEKFAEYEPKLAACLDDPRIMGPVQDMLGDAPVLFKEKINLKLPGSGGFDPHQDMQPGWDRYAGYFVTALLAVDDSNEENGCLELAAGHHTRGLIGRLWEPLVGQELDGVEFETYPMQPGDLAFFDCFVPHRSSPNPTAGPRRNLYLTFNAAFDGDQRERYFADKRASYPPDFEREPGKLYTFRV